MGDRPERAQVAPQPPTSARRAPAADDAEDLQAVAGLEEDPSRAGRGRRWAWVWALVGAVAGLVAALALVQQLQRVDVGNVVRTADPGWLGLAVLTSCLPFLGAATAITAFSPVRLRAAPTLAVQVAGNFVNLLGPAGLGGMALNARYLHERGARAAAAVAAVGAVQAVSVADTVLVLVVAVALSRRAPSGVRLLPDEVTLVTVGVLVALACVVVAVPPVRRWVARRVGPPLRQAAATLRAVATQPGRLAVGAVGNLLVTAGFVLVLEASLRAFGASVPLLELAVVLFAGTAVGSVFPVPGGAGTVEAAIAAGLVAVGVDPAAAVLTAVAYRVATLWLWVLPGWVLALMLRRAGHI